MNKLTSSVLGLSAVIAGGIMYFLTPQFGVDYSKKPSVPIVSLTERITLPKSQKTELTWQNNLDQTVNPNPTITDYIFPYSLCNLVTNVSTINTTTHRKTSNSTELRFHLQEQIGTTNQLKKTDIPGPKTFFPLATSCTKPLDQKILTAEVQYQAIASDDNSDRGENSIFSPDDVNLSTAVKRNKKISKEIIQLTKSQPTVKITPLEPVESNLSPDDIKMLLKKQYPSGNDFERLEIMAQISMIDRKMLNNDQLKDIMALHRGVKVNVIQNISTQNVITFPAPLGLSPLLLMVPTVRVSAFSFVRVIITSCIYTINTIVRLGLFIISRTLQLLLIVLKKLAKLLNKVTKKLTRLSLILAKKLILKTSLVIQNLVKQITYLPTRIDKLSFNSQFIVDDSAKGSKAFLVNSTKIIITPFSILLLKSKLVCNLIIYNSLALITKKPNGQAHQKVYQIPFSQKTQVLIQFKTTDQYTSLQHYIEAQKDQKSFYETEKMIVKIVKS